MTILARVERLLTAAAARLRRRRLARLTQAPGPVRVITDCTLCLDTWAALDHAAGDLEIDATPDRRAHVLSSVCSWWAAHALQAHDKNPIPLARVFAKALSENGIPFHIVSVDLPPPVHEWGTKH